MADLTTEQIEKVITDSLISFGANAEDINRERSSPRSTSTRSTRRALADHRRAVRRRADERGCRRDHDVGDAIDLVAERG